MTTKNYKFDDFGYEVEIGKVAKQADGAVWFKQGGTVILAAAVSTPAAEFPGFLPLTVDYREQFSAAGKIPGGYFKREGRPGDREVLTSRLIDRAIRPLFPPHFFNQVQVLMTVFSVDKNHAPNTVALLAASLALSISRIPFLGPVGVVEIGRVEGEWVVNPTYPQMLESDVRLVVAGTDEGICMVEGAMNEIPESDVVDMLFKAHDEIKRSVKWQSDIVREIGIPKSEITGLDWSTWEKRVSDFLTEDHIVGIYVPEKVKRNEFLSNIRDQFSEQYASEIEADGISKKVINYLFDDVMKDQITERIFKLSKRVDGRAYDDVRHISGEVGLLPFTHGSALFTRGGTQALVSVTLGSGQDEQRKDNIMSAEGGETEHFMLHYNFPPYSVGETAFLRGPGRREVGHGHLAASALRPMLPSKEEFPYTLRIVADMLESDGSTSQATICGASLALMDAGVPLTRMVGGIAMGLLKSEQGEFAILSDISGFEDAFGLMDFKVAGTSDGLTAIQMDIKYKGGLPREIFDRALEQARKGRLHILERMSTVLDKPREELSELVPRVVAIKIDPDKIGAVIGGGGKTIKAITETTKTQIDIEQQGLVRIFGTMEADLDKAVSWVKTLAGQIEVGSLFDGKVRRTTDFGIFVELVPGLDGLVHVSNIPKEQKRTFAQDFEYDDLVQVQVLDHDPKTGRIGLKLLKKL